MATGWEMATELRMISWIWFGVMRDEKECQSGVWVWELTKLVKLFGAWWFIGACVYWSSGFHGVKHMRVFNSPCHWKIIHRRLVSSKCWFTNLKQMENCVSFGGKEGSNHSRAWNLTQLLRSFTKRRPRFAPSLARGWVFVRPSFGHTPFGQGR